MDSVNDSPSCVNLRHVNMGNECSPCVYHLLNVHGERLLKFDQSFSEISPICLFLMMHCGLAVAKYMYMYYWCWNSVANAE
jgi:hypothetical protein